MTDETTFAAARSVLTDTEYLTWALAENGISRQAIAYYRRVTKGTVNACLIEADRKIREALNGKDPDAAAAAGGGAAARGPGGARADGGHAG